MTSSPSDGRDAELLARAFDLSCEDQFQLATKIAANVGYVLVGEPSFDKVDDIPSPIHNPSKEELARIIDPQAFVIINSRRQDTQDRQAAANGKADLILARLAANPPDPDSMNDKRAEDKPK